MNEEMQVDDVLAHANKLNQSLIVAEMVKLSDRLDMDVLGEMLADERRYQTIEPMFDPTAWMKGHEGMEAAARVISAARSFAKVVRENKSSNGRGY
jgi:hypothetical protein